MAKNKPELISPAGDFEKLKIAFLYGADAVYASTPKFSMRSRGEIKFDDKTLKEGIDYAHSIGKKVYLTLNTYPHASEIEEFKKHAKKTIKFSPDAVICADPGVIDYLKTITNIPLHLSTQANTVNHLSANFWQKQGISRIVLARELCLKDIQLIYNNLSSQVPKGTLWVESRDLKIEDFSTANKLASRNDRSVELEAFVHGAMCMAYSGRCQISNYMVGRDPNKGECIQACRFKYKFKELDIEEELRPGEKFKIYEDESGSYLLNSKDLCMIDHIPDLIDAGVTSFKIEGRLKSIYYVGIITRAYRKAIDMYFENPKEYLKTKNKLLAEVAKTSNRGFTTGFYYQKPNEETNNYATSRAASQYDFVGLVRKYDINSKLATVEVRNRLLAGTNIEIVTPDDIVKHKLNTMYHKGEKATQAHAGYIIKFSIDQPLPVNSFVRRKAEK
jgi:putative protease